MLRESDHVIEVGERVLGWWGMQRLRQPKVIENELRVRIEAGELINQGQLLRAKYAHWKGLGDRRGDRRSDLIMLGAETLGHAGHQPDANCPRCIPPSGDGVSSLGLVRVNRRDQPEATGMGAVDLDNVTGIGTIERPRRNQQRPVDPDVLHRGNQVVARDGGRSWESPSPRSPRVVPVIRVNLSIYYTHSGMLAHLVCDGSTEGACDR